MIEEQQNNPLHGLKLDTLVAEIVDFYGWKILYAALKLECFNTNPTVESCIKFLKKTEWAREKVENFYLYRFKRMPKATGAQFDLKPRERGFAAGIAPRKPMELTIESIAKMQAQAASQYESKAGTGRHAKPSSGARSGSRDHTNRGQGSHTGSQPRRPISTDASDPWGTKAK